MRKLVSLVVALMAIAAVTAGGASAATGSPATFDGNGLPLSSQSCGANADDGNTGGDVSGNYLLWNLAGSSNIAGPVTLHLPPPAGDVQMVLNGTWKYVSPVFPKADLVAFPVTATWASGGTVSNLVVSHGCTESKLDGKIKTDIKVGSDTVTSASLGSIVHDTVTFTPADGSSVADMTADAKVTYHFYKGECGDNSNEVGSGETVDAGLDSSPTAALAAGSYHYTASYTGNDKYNAITASDCEPLTINKGQLTVTTVLHGINGAHNDVTNSHQPLGSTVHDTATVSGAVAGFDIGAVSFTRNNVHVDNAATAEPGFAASTVQSEALAAGSWVYKARVEGNSNYDEATSGDEPLTIDRAQLQITTDIHNAAHQIVTAVSTSAIVHDTATVTGKVGDFALPAVTFTLDGGSIATDTDTDGTTTANSVNVGPLTAGAHKFNATVIDNANYIGKTSADEPLSVGQAWCSPGYWKNAKDAAWAKIGLTSAAVGKSKTFNSTVAAAGFYPLLTGANVNVTIGQVLSASGANTYGSAAGLYHLNPFNATGAYLTSLIPGYTFSGSTLVDNCPLDNAGNFKPGF
jgi:hypothetical protein